MKFSESLQRALPIAALNQKVRLFALQLQMLFRKLSLIQARLRQPGPLARTLRPGQPLGFGRHMMFAVRIFSPLAARCASTRQRIAIHFGKEYCQAL